MCFRTFDLPVAGLASKDCLREAKNEDLCFRFFIQLSFAHEGEFFLVSEC